MGVGPPWQRQSDEPLHEVPEIEAHDKEFQHLCGVNALVLDEFRGDGDALAAEQQSADVDGVILAERNQSVVNDFPAYC